jgi:hypothetical protein
MKQVTQHRFIDLAAPAEDDASDKLKARRDFMRRMGIAAFAASATPASRHPVGDVGSAQYAAERASSKTVWREDFVISFAQIGSQMIALNYQWNK